MQNPDEVIARARPFFRARFFVADNRADDFWNGLVLPGDEHRSFCVNRGRGEIILVTLWEAQVELEIQVVRQGEDRVLRPQTRAVLGDSRREDRLRLFQPPIDELSVARRKQPDQRTAPLPTPHDQLFVVALALRSHGLGLFGWPFGMTDQHDLGCRHAALSK